MNKAPYPFDLHCHSTRSDGGDTYEELCAVASARGVRAFVVADHDVMPDLKPNGEDLLSFGAKRGAYILPAIEFSCDTLVPDVHIVGIGCDFSDSSFHEFELEMARSKMGGYKKIVELLAEDGMPITWDDVLHQNGMDIDEMALQGKHIFNAIALCGGAEDWAAAKKMIQTTPRYSAIKREKIDPTKAIEMVRASGGFAILAHPHLIPEHPRDMTRAQYIERLIDAGLQGIEAAYPYNKTSYRGTSTPEAIEREIRETYTGRLFISGGSDYHNDAKSGSKNPRLMGEKGVFAKDILSCEPLAQIVNTWAPDVLTL
ncbi:MAG: PHP domain-containing protein [Clostridia bacterium]|nr:PHP domain-containing protein [Clostridia bacterium]